MSACCHAFERLLCEELYTEHFQGRLFTQAMSSNKPVPGCPGICARTVFLALHLSALAGHEPVITRWPCSWLQECDMAGSMEPNGRF
uniref:Alternative protein MANBA n=1 Tax=Homo sapiens TaxID=9606 RepID=L8E9D5_HUMAN|nr:alternative protein MANBA [Homo sapiens]